VERDRALMECESPALSLESRVRTNPALNNPKRRCSNSTEIVQHGSAAIMENCPPYRLAPPSPLMHARSSSKSSPLKRDATRVLAPQYNHAVPPSDAFNTGLLTPQASQNTFDSDAATSLISPPPEDTARAGFSDRPHRDPSPAPNAIQKGNPFVTPSLPSRRLPLSADPLPHCQPPEGRMRLPPPARASLLTDGDYALPMTPRR
jgi:hypothetical protein